MTVWAKSSRNETTQGPKWRGLGAWNSGFEERRGLEPKLVGPGGESLTRT